MAYGQGSSEEYKVKNRVVKRFEAAEYTVPFSSVIANQRYDGMKMTSGKIPDDPLDESITAFQFGSGYDGKLGITPADWLKLKNSPDTSDGGPVVVVTETSPTTLVVSETQEPDTTYTE